LRALKRREASTPRYSRFDMPDPPTDRTDELTALLRERILVLDGAMGTMVQTYDLEERDYRSERFRDWHCDLKNNNDLLVLTRPAIIQEIHRRYLDAGADVIETNPFAAQATSQADHALDALSHERNRA